MSKERKVRIPSFFEALIPIIVVMALMIYVFAIDRNYDGAHMPLIIGIAVACFVGSLCGHTFEDMMAGIVERLTNTLEAILILCTVGLLVSSFMISGTIPALVYYGLDLLSPKFFLPVGCFLCAIVGLACGSSWTTTATMGIAFLAIGEGLGINPALTAGMIISGAYVGDKFSPLSDTTNLAAGVSNTGLFDHVTAMVSTTGPVFIIALIIYTIIGMRMNGNYNPEIVNEMKEAITSVFHMNPILLLPVIAIIAVCLMKLPGLVGVMISVLLGVIFALIFQNPHYTLADIFLALHYGPTELVEIGLETEGAEIIKTILGKGGMDGQMWTINLVIIAVAFGGAIERCGAVEALFGKLKHKLNSVGSLVFATMLTSIFCDAALCDQFLGIGVPAPLYVDKYDELGLGRNMLSRTLEDAGTLWSPMFPWTACGAYQQGVLGMSPFVYFPFAFVNLLNPIYAAITAYMGRNIFWADGSYTNIFGVTKAGKPAGCPEKEHQIALANLEKRRSEGKAPNVK